MKDEMQNVCTQNTKCSGCAEHKIHRQNQKWNKREKKDALRIRHIRCIFTHSWFGIWSIRSYFVIRLIFFFFFFSVLFHSVFLWMRRWNTIILTLPNPPPPNPQTKMSYSFSCSPSCPVKLNVPLDYPFYLKSKKENFRSTTLCWNFFFIKFSFEWGKIHEISCQMSMPKQGRWHPALDSWSITSSLSFTNERGKKYQIEFCSIDS